MSQEIFQKGALTWRAGQKLLGFINSLDEQQKTNGVEAFKEAMTAYQEHIPDEVRPVLEHVLESSNEPVWARLLGAAYHPSLREWLMGMVKKDPSSMTKADVEGWMKAQGGTRLQCPSCQDVVVVGAPKPVIEE